MKWQRKLTKKEIGHIKETTNRPTLEQFKRNFEHQQGSQFPCWECRAIARKLGILAELKPEIFALHHELQSLRKVSS
jgi:hypothetical protein